MRTFLRLLITATGLLLGGCAATHMAPAPEQTQTLAVTGKLRVGIFSTNPLYARKDPATGAFKGVAVDLGKELARRIGVPFELVHYPSIAAIIDNAETGQWDAAFLTINAARTKVMDFSAPYAEVEVGYLVPGGSAIADLSSIDRTGIRIAVAQKGGPDVRLSASLKQAALMRVPSLVNALELVKSGQAHAMAANKTYLYSALGQVPGGRVLEGRISAERIGIAVPKGRGFGASYVRRFVEDAKREGLVLQAIEDAGLRGVVVAPLAP